MDQSCLVTTSAESD